MNQSESSSGGGAKPDTKEDEAQEVKEAKAFDETKQSAKKPSVIKRAWQWLALDKPTFFMMIKAAIPPTIALAFYQADAVSAKYTTIGYLIGIASVLGFAIMPRAKFLQTITLNVLAVCMSSAVNMLAMYTVVRARITSTPPGQPPSPYNSSASVVAAIWLIFQTYLVNSLRSARPQLMFPGIIYSIFLIVSLSYSPLFPNLAAVYSFLLKLFSAFLTGLALATGVSLFIFPVSSRTVAFKEMSGYLSGLRGLVKLQVNYLESLEHIDMFGLAASDTGGDEKAKKKEKKQTPASSLTSEALALKGAVVKMRQLHAKLNADLTFAKRESAWGKLEASDLDEIARMLRETFLPIYGMSSIIDIFQRVSAKRGWNEPFDQQNEETKQAKAKSIAEWQNIMKALHKPFQGICADMDLAFEHIMLVLEFKKRPKQSKSNNAEDTEAQRDTTQPGETGFAEAYDQRTLKFYESRKITLKAWCEHHDIDFSSNSFNNDLEWAHAPSDASMASNQKDLFVVLYMEYLLWSASRAVYKLVLFADLKAASGTMKKNRLIVPAAKLIRKWLASITAPEDASNDDHYVMEAFEASGEIYLGDAYAKAKDPEHLPPTTTLEKITGYLASVPKALRSPHSVFGFRVACATMTVAILDYLHDTYIFYNQQRLLWAQIMIAISMSRTAGQSLFNFILRIGGTVIAMLASYVVWYIVDGHTAGVIVFMFVWIAIAFYVVLKMPQYVVAGMISAVTVVLIIGYELQTKKIGLQAAISNGQLYYPLYELAPYRLATVTGGLAIAYFWTIFPFPVAESSELRRSLGKALSAVCRYYASIHETVKLRVNGTDGNLTFDNSPGRKLETARNDAFTKAMLLVSKMKSESQFSRWQVHWGGKFPKETYDKIITNVETIINYSALLGFASATFEQAEDATERQWLHDFRNLLGSVTTTSHEVTTILSLLSSSISTGQPLPPYTKAPEPFQLLQKLEEYDKDILSVRHIDEPGYAAFAVMQISSTIIVSDLADMIESVKELVGELDFSFHGLSRLSDLSDDQSSSLLADSKNNKDD